MKLFILALSLCFASETFHNAPTSFTHRNNPAHSEQDIKKGAALFAQNCASCHGKDAMGAGNIPALAIGPAQTAPEGEMFWFITKGSPEAGMPPAKISEKERWQVISFIKSLKGVKAQAQEPQLSNDDSHAPPPPAPFTDYRYERPGQMHKILPKDLPAPAPETSAGNAPDVVKRPLKAWPQVPKGFKVEVYAEHLEQPRAMRTAPNGDIFVAESRAGKILVLRGGTRAEKTEVFAGGLDRPYGLAFYPPGNDPKWIYIGNTDSVVRFPYHTGELKAAGKPEKIADLPSSFRGHWTRDLQFSLDGKKLFAAVGSASNIDDSENEKNRADILVMTPEGKDIKVFASGIRNAGGGLAVQPKTGALWCSVNERDGLGDNLVSDYITHVEEGGFYGWPWWYIGGHQDPRHQGKHPELKSKLINPDVLLQAHHASLQLAFYEGKQFPKEYRGDIFAAQHGSWNRSVRTGYSVIRVPLHGKGKATGEYEDFMTGFVVNQRAVWGRPVGVTVAADGALLVSDDESNTIWRVSWVK